MPGKFANFLKELKRRKVYRVATVYAITGWIIIQVASSTFSYLNIPDGIIAAVIVLVIIGFPVSLILAWAYELSPDGIIITTSEEARNNTLPPSKKKPFTSKLTIVVLVILVMAQFVYFTFIRQDKEKLADEIREEKVAVAVFNNFTDDKTLDAFGFMASDLITSGLRQIKVKTSSPEMMRKCRENVGILPGNQKNQVSLFDLTGAKYVVTGSYYLQGDQLQVSSQLESTETGDIIFDFPTIKGHKDDREGIILEIREKLKGFWAVKEEENLSKYSPPQYDAYNIFKSSRFLDYKSQLEALSIDSTFLMARVYLYYSSYLYELDSINRATRRYVLAHWDECTEFEKNYFNFVENDMNKNYTGALEALNRNYELDPLDMTMLHESAFFYASLNQPKKAVERWETVFSKYETYKDKLTPNMYVHYFENLSYAGQTKKAIVFAEDLKKNHPEVLQHFCHIVFRAFLIERDFERVDEWLTFLDENNISIEYQYLAYYYNTLYPEDSTNYFESHLRQRLENFSEYQESWRYLGFTTIRLFNYDSKASIFYLLKDFKEAEKQVLKLTQVDWESQYESEEGQRYSSRLDIWANGLLGAIYARQNKKEEALKQIEVLEAKRAIFPKFANRKSKGSIPYYQARIYAILGEKDLAVDYLKKSKLEGNIAEHDKFVFDWDLTNLKGYPPFEKLLKFD